jgi:hypothetical protein
MTNPSRNTLSTIEREFILFLREYISKTSNVAVPISEIEAFIRTSEGIKGLELFGLRKQPTTPTPTSQRIGVLL